jgi:hypothetical protein
MKAWDSKGLWLKSKQFIDKANSYDHSSGEFPFWSALALECLARSALTKVHPALNADPRDDVNLLYAFGYPVVGQPRSLPAHSVYIRLEKIVKGFGKTQRELCDFMAILRNQHLHSSDLPYDNLKISKWLPRFYEVAKVLNEFLGKSLEDYLGPEVASSATKHIKTLSEAIKSTVKSRISEHNKKFNGKPPQEQTQLKGDASIAVKRLPLWAVACDCPACGGKGILEGELIKELEPVYKDEELLVDQIYLASEFQCLACELTLKGLEEIAHADIEPQFTKTTSTSLHELYEPEHYEEYDNM